MSDEKDAQKPTTPEPEILEIRVHGVLNTAPAEMLRADPDEIRRHSGDNLGFFWRRKVADPEHLAPGVVETEAFSWGAQARTGGGSLTVIGRAAVHVGWFLLLPYALANLAYWTRRIDERPPSPGVKKWEGGTGAATVRIFGLLLTLIGVAAFCSVAIDLIAVQCFPDPKHVCASLPSPFELLKDRDRDERTAILGLIPIAVILVLFLLSWRGRVRFEQGVKRFGKSLGDPDESSRPLLATRGFWAVARTAQTTERSHFTASIALVLLVLALDAAYSDEDCFRTVGATLDASCIAQGWNDPLPAAFLIGAFALLIGAIVLVGLASATRTDRATSRKRRFASIFLLLSIAGYLAWTILTFTSALETTTATDKRVVGLNLFPIALVVIALFLAAAGLAWRKSQPWRVTSTILLFLGAIMLLANLLPLNEWFPRDSPAEATSWIGVGSLVLAALFIGSHLLIAWFAPDHKRSDHHHVEEGSQRQSPEESLINYRFHAWGGRGRGCDAPRTLLRHGPL